MKLMIWNATEERCASVSCCMGDGDEADVWNNVRKLPLSNMPDYILTLNPDNPVGPHYAEPIAAFVGRHWPISQED